MGEQRPPGVRVMGMKSEIAEWDGGHGEMESGMGETDPERRQQRMLSSPGGVVRRNMPMLLTLDGAITIATASGKDDWCDDKTDTKAL
jgi:hypothetical protein